jgi:hypothetical protein
MPTQASRGSWPDERIERVMIAPRTFHGSRVWPWVSPHRYVDRHCRVNTSPRVASTTTRIDPAVPSGLVIANRAAHPLPTRPWQGASAVRQISAKSTGQADVSATAAFEYWSAMDRAAAIARRISGGGFAGVVGSGVGADGPQPYASSTHPLRTGPDIKTSATTDTATFRNSTIRTRNRSRASSLTIAPRSMLRNLLMLRSVAPRERE